MTTEGKLSVDRRSLRQADVSAPDVLLLHCCPSMAYMQGKHRNKRLATQRSATTSVFPMIMRDVLPSCEQINVGHLHAQSQGVRVLQG
jgi:hypothetical protein